MLYIYFAECNFPQLIQVWSTRRFSNSFPTSLLSQVPNWRRQCKYPIPSSTSSFSSSDLFCNSFTSTLDNRCRVFSSSLIDGRTKSDSSSQPIGSIASPHRTKWAWHSEVGPGHDRLTTYLPPGWQRGLNIPSCTRAPFLDLWIFIPFSHLNVLSRKHGQSS